MNARSLRRLAADHAALQTQPLPPNYLFPPSELGPSSSSDDLTQLDILLAGPSHTPFAHGLFKLHITIPAEYPTRPPTAHFRTPIFHPNVDPQNGAVCVETLKRDWHAKLTLRDVLITISCLLIQPNPDSALNSDAAALIRDDFEAFAQRAKLMASIQACVPRGLADAVAAAQQVGQEATLVGDGDCPTDVVMKDSEAAGVQAGRASGESGQPVARRRRAFAARVRDAAAECVRKRDLSPSTAVDAVADRGSNLLHAESSSLAQRPFVLSTNDDIFDSTRAIGETSVTKKGFFEDESMSDPDQENDASRSPIKASPAKVITPRRPHGTPVPLGELIMEEEPIEEEHVIEDKDETFSDADDAADHEVPPNLDSSSPFLEGDDIAQEYPPSPCKSPAKSPSKSAMRQRQLHEGSGTSRLQMPRNITPLNTINTPLAADSPFASIALGRVADVAATAADSEMRLSPSPKKARQGRGLLFQPPTRATRRNLFTTPGSQDSIDQHEGLEIETQDDDAEELDDSILHLQRQHRHRAAANNDPSFPNNFGISPNTSTSSLSRISQGDTFRISKRKSPPRKPRYTALRDHHSSPQSALIVTQSTVSTSSCFTQSNGHSDTYTALMDRGHLWNLCGGDIRRWNRGDFNDAVIHGTAGRW